MEPPFLFLIPFLCSFYALLTPSMAANTIAMNQTIRDGDQITIISPQQTFELGFFSPTITTHNRYLGIWYKRLATGTVAWVANRQTPIANKTGELTLHPDGVLVLRDSTTNTIIWSSGISTTAATPNPFAQLLDNGNLMVVDNEGGIDGPDDYIWQSFDHPGNTYLPGMKFGRNLQKGVVTNFTSWKKDDDPSEGDYMVYVDFNGVPQVYQKKGDMIQMRLGSWNGLSFTGMHKPDSVFKFKQVSNEKEIYYIFELDKSSNLIKIMLNPAGDFVRLNWNNRTKEWSLFSTPELEDKCSKYMLCGPYASCNTDLQFPVCECLKGFVPKSPPQWDAGDWTSGCQRKITLDCGVGEGFLKYSSMKLPDTRRSWFDRKMNLKQCRVKCINECNCSAYSSLDIRVNTTGCMLWYDELVDIRSFSKIGQDIYIRTEKRKKRLSKKKKAMVIGIPVTAGTVGLAILIGLRVLTMMRKPQGGRHDPTAKGPQKQNPHDPSLLLDANNSFSNKKDEDEEGGSEPVNKTRRVNRGKGRVSSKASSNTVERGNPPADETNDYDATTLKNEPDQIQQDDDEVVDPSSKSESRTRCRICLEKMPRDPIQRPKNPTDPPVSHHPNAVDMEMRRVNKVMGRGSRKNNNNIVGRGDPRVDETNDYEDDTFTNELDQIQQEDNAVVGPSSKSESRTRCHKGLRKTPRHPSQRPETPKDPPVSHHLNTADMELKEETYGDLDPSTIPPDDPELWELSDEGQPRNATTGPPGTTSSVTLHAANDEKPHVNRGKGRGSNKDNSNIVGQGDPRVDKTNDYEDSTFTKELDRIQKEDDAVVGPFSRSESRTKCRNTLRKTPRHPSRRPETPMDPPASHHPNAADMELKEKTYDDIDPSTIPRDDTELWERFDEGQPRFAMTSPPGASYGVSSYAIDDEMNRGKGKGSSKDGSNIVERDDPRTDETNYYEDATFNNAQEQIQQEDDAVVGDPLVDETSNYADSTFNNAQDQIQQEDDAVVGPFSRSESRTRCRNTLMKTPSHPTQRPEMPMDPLVSHHPNAADMELKEKTYGDLDPSTIPPDDPELWERGDEGQPRFATTSPPSASFSVSSYAADDEMNRGKGKGSSEDSSNIVERDDHRTDETNYYEDVTFNNAQDQIQQEDDAVVGDPRVEETSDYGDSTLNNAQDQIQQEDDAVVRDPRVDETSDYADSTFNNAQDQIQQEDDAVVGQFSRSESRTRCRNTLLKTPRHPSQRPETPMDPLMNRGKGKGSSKDSSNIVERDDPRTDETNYYEDATFNNAQDQIQQEDDAVVGPFLRSESMTRCRNTLMKTPRHLSQRPDTPMDPLVSYHPNAADMVLKEETYGDLDPSTIPPDDPKLWERSDEEQPRFATTGPPCTNSSVTSYAAHDEMRRINRVKGRGFSNGSCNIVSHGDPHADETNDYEDATFTNKLDQIQQEDDAIVGPFSGSESKTRCRNTLRKTPKHPSQRPETPMDSPVYHYSKATGMPVIEETYVDLDPSTILTDDQELWERSDEGQPRFAVTDLLGANSNVTSYVAYDEKRLLNKGKGRGSSEASSNTIGHGDTRTDSTNDYDVAIFTNESDLIQLEDDAVVVLSSGSESRTRCRNTLRKTPRHLSQRLETPTYPPIYHYPKAIDMMLKEETYVDLDPSTIPPGDPESLERSDEGQPRFAKTGHPGASNSVTSYGVHDEVYALKEKLMTYEE